MSKSIYEIIEGRVKATALRFFDTSDFTAEEQRLVAVIKTILEEGKAISAENILLKSSVGEMLLYMQLINEADRITHNIER